MIIAFLVDNKDENSDFFEETFLLAIISMNIGLKMLLLNLSNVKVYFTT